MSPQKRVPNELWIEIFGLLPLDSIKNIYATDKHFARTSRAFLFRHFVFYPYHIDRVSRHVVLPAPDGVQFALGRLEFWTSDEIFPLVRECSIALRDRRAEEARPVPLDRTESPDILMNSFLDRLGRFTGLQKFSARQVDFTQVGLANLCHLPLLREVMIERCGMLHGETIDTTSLELRTTKFVYHDGLTAHEGPDLWLSILARGHLREVVVVTGRHKAASRLADGPAFPHVVALQISLDLSDMNLVTLSKFPAVRHLQLDGWGLSGGEAEASSVPASDVLPLLREYHGPYTALPLFLSRPTLAHLIIDCCTAWELSSQLRGQHGHITSLSATLYQFDQETFSTICTCLPGLIDLRIQTYRIIEDDADAFMINNVASPWISSSHWQIVST
ncbi:hypothetical protein FB45DRAFT_1116496 [Roridomyces roridus]|uniref:F-box domain-containing protein n=1 Tax=Roridomyces roridus TaxID=1738132 RepID=A0AAD7CC50_9AGAR|nr:hypothetical protein FB45DRAFT_1116496 [Roridomyces roridus]